MPLSSNPFERLFIIHIECILVMIFFFPTHIVCKEKYNILDTPDVIIQYENSLEAAANETVSLYLKIKTELETSFRWDMKPRPVIVLIKTSETFLRISGNQYVAALALPSKNLIIIDYSKMNRKPFQVSVTLKHEMCHLLLHHNIKSQILPKWLDEGVAQWISNGPAELLRTPDQFFLGHAVLSGDLIPLNNLHHRFPKSKKLFFLAYEESKSTIEYISQQYGKDKLFAILENLSTGDEIESAVQKNLSISFDEFEKKWRNSLTSGSTWIAYLSLHIYEILFLFAATLTVFGFVRLILKKKAYQDEDDEDWI